MNIALVMLALLIYAGGWLMDVRGSKDARAHGWLEDSWMCNSDGYLVTWKLHVAKGALLAFILGITVVVWIYGNPPTAAWFLLGMSVLATVAAALAVEMFL